MNTAFPMTLLADIGVDDVIKILVVVLFLFGSLIAKVVSSLFEQPQARPAGPGGPEGQAADVEEQLARWLRRAEDAEHQEAEVQAAAPRPAEVFEAEPVRAARGRPFQHPAPYAAKQPPMQPSVDAPPPLAKPAVAASQVRRLISEIGQADERLEKHLTDTFQQHRTGLDQAKGTPVFTVAEGTDAAAWEAGGAAAGHMASRIIDQLTSPHSVRDAIVLAEILRRPDHRW